MNKTVTLSKTGRPRKMDKDKAKWDDRINCEVCGGSFLRSSRTRHNRTKVHKMAEQFGGIGKIQPEHKKIFSGSKQNKKHPSSETIKKRSHENNISKDEKTPLEQKGGKKNIYNIHNRDVVHDAIFNGDTEEIKQKIRNLTKF